MADDTSSCHSHGETGGQDGFRGPVWWVARKAHPPGTQVVEGLKNPHRDDRFLVALETRVGPDALQHTGVMGVARVAVKTGKLVFALAESNVCDETMLALRVNRPGAQELLVVVTLTAYCVLLGLA